MTTNTPKIAWNTSAEELTRIYETDLNGKVAIVTGANSGIGLETARVLSKVGAKVIIPCRSMEKAIHATEVIRTSVPNANLIPMVLDLSDLSSIQAFAKEFLALETSLHLLVNNAGIMACPKSFTKDGFETQFGVNHLGHFYLTQLLTDKLKASAPARVVSVSSAANFHFLGPEGFDFDNLNAEKSYNPSIAYGQAKLCNIFFAKELQRRFDAENVDVIVTSLHPGAVESNLGRHIDFSAAWSSLSVTRGFGSLLKEIWHYKKVQVGASTSIYCCISPDVIKGEFYADNAVNRTVLHEQADNKEMAKRLWDTSENLLNSKLSS